jgi:hypothetical protein
LDVQGFRKSRGPDEKNRGKEMPQRERGLAHVEELEHCKPCNGKRCLKEKEVWLMSRNWSTVNPATMERSCLRVKAARKLKDRTLYMAEFGRLGG